MIKYIKNLTGALLIVILTTSCSKKEEETLIPAKAVIERLLGSEKAATIQLKKVEKEEGKDVFSYEVRNGQFLIEASSPVAATRGFYEYLRKEVGGMVAWSGNNLNLPDQWPDTNLRKVVTPFKYHYYFNTVTHGYTTPYWDWQRWEKELDWMALHGLDMPLIAGAHEAILLRVFKKIGLTEEEALDYFSGPAHFPWNRMGNIGGWDGPPPVSFFDQQIELTHKMLNRMDEMEMHPIVHAFAGFVPKAIKRIYPEEELRELGWGGFDKKVHILSPESDLFVKIGKSYIQEWEKEFGTGHFFLADSFNEMDVPLSEDPQIAKEELAKFGEAVYKPISEANPDAVWVMQGWTFPYHRDKQGKLFWTPERLKAFFSKIPDGKLLILDMANEYNALFWKIDYSWKMYDGFFGKQWIYSFIPNMGGKTPLNGVLDFYAKAPEEALNFEQKQNLVGFGFAPEGIENNEMIYELISDWGWRNKKIDLAQWQQEYAKARYDAYPEPLKQAYELLNTSALGTFTDHPRYVFQFRPGRKRTGTVHTSEQFEQAVGYFFEAKEDLGANSMYRNDAIELATQLLALKVDEYIKEGIEGKQSSQQQAINLLLAIDKLLASHPNHKLSNWINHARTMGNTEAEKDYYESNAKRLVTTWGGQVDDYSARLWSGLIREYYVPRWQYYFESGEIFDFEKWEENWIKSPSQTQKEIFDKPLEMAYRLLQEEFGF